MLFVGAASRHSLSSHIQIGVDLRLDVFQLRVGLALHELLGHASLLSCALLGRLSCGSGLVVDAGVLDRRGI